MTSLIYFHVSKRPGTLLVASMVRPFSTFGFTNCDKKETRAKRVTFYRFPQLGFNAKNFYSAPFHWTVLYVMLTAP